MQIKQRNLRVFHAVVDDEKAFLEFLEKNTPLLREFFLLIEGEVTKGIVLYLQEAGICFRDISNCNLKLSSPKRDKDDREKIRPKQESLLPKEEKKVTKEEIIESKEPEKEAGLEVFNRPIRSGEELHLDSDCVIFGRVNSGAKLFCEKSLTLYGIIDGFVQCDGEFIILRGISPKGVLLFGGELVSSNLLESDKLQKITSLGKEIKVEEI